MKNAFGRLGGKKGIKIVSWNIAGIINIKRAIEYVREFDIIALQETWLEKEKEKEWLGKLNKGYK